MSTPSLSVVYVGTNMQEPTCLHLVYLQFIYLLRCLHPIFCCLCRYQYVGTNMQVPVCLHLVYLRFKYLLICLHPIFGCLCRYQYVGTNMQVPACLHLVYLLFMQAKRDIHFCVWAFLWKAQPIEMSGRASQREREREREREMVLPWLTISSFDSNEGNECRGGHNKYSPLLLLC